MDRAVTKIEKKKAPAVPLTRVAAYSRVSTGKDAMLHSLTAQISYYSDYIQRHPGWLFCGVFSDEATTGTKEDRAGFQALLRECRAGNIDLVITKSISRFARNTVVLLETVRELKELGIDVYFEEQNIHTISPDGELMLTILASYAQEESLSASENQKWRVQKGFEAGIPYDHTLLGYRGSALLQKKITTDFLSKRQKPNEGEAPQYYIEQSHEAIIPPDEWEIVQLEMARRKALGHKYSGNSIFSARLVCADCGEFFGSKVWNSTDKYRRTIWQCNGKYKGEHRCTTPHLEEQYIRDAFVAAFNSLIRRKDELTRNCQFVMDRYTDCADLDAQLSRLEDELTIVTGLIQKWVAENAKTAQDTDAFMAKCREYDDRYRELQSKVEVIEEEKRVRQGRVKRFELFMQALKKQHSELTEFDESTWLAVIDTVLVKPDGKLVFRFANGMEVER